MGTLFGLGSPVWTPPCIDRVCGGYSPGHYIVYTFGAQREDAHTDQWRIKISEMEKLVVMRMETNLFLQKT